MRNLLKVSAVCVLSIAWMTDVCCANLLSNVGFETGDLTGWTVGGPNGGYGVLSDGESIPGVTYSEFLPSLQNVRSGIYAAYAVTANGNGEYVSFAQELSLAPGEYTASFYMGHDEGVFFGIGNAINAGRLGIWVNGSLLEFNSSYANTFHPGSDPSDFTLFDADFISSGGLTTVEFRISGSGTARAGISVDDFALVPEPATILLLGLGGIALLRKRGA